MNTCTVFKSMQSVYQVDTFEACQLDITSKQHWFLKRNNALFWGGVVSLFIIGGVLLC